MIVDAPVAGMGSSVESHSEELLFKGMTDFVATALKARDTANKLKRPTKGDRLQTILVSLRQLVTEQDVDAVRERGHGSMLAKEAP